MGDTNNYPLNYPLILDGLADAHACYRYFKEDMLSSFCNTAPIFLVLIDVRGKVCFMNYVMLQALGYSLEEVVGEDYIETCVPQSEKDTLQEIFSMLLKDKKPTRNENCLLSKKGKRILVEWYGRPLFKEDGQCDCFCGLGIDITERKQVEEALKKREEEYRTLLENLPVGVYRVTPGSEGTFLMANPAFLRIFGFKSLEELKKIKMRDLYLNPENRKTASDKVIKEKGYGSSELTLQRLDGSIIYCLDIAQLIRDEDGNPHHFDCIIEDITDRKKAEELLHSQLEFEKIVSEISSNFLNLPTEQIDEGINLALQLTGEYFDVDRSSVFLFSEDKTTITNTHEWCAENISSVKGRNQRAPVSNTPWWIKQILDHEYVSVSDVDTLPPEAEQDKKDFKIEGIKSLLTIPMVRGNTVIGFFGLDAVKEKKQWSEKDISLLKVVAEIITNALERFRAEQVISRHNMELELKSKELAELYRKLDEEIGKAVQVHERTLPKKLPQIENIAFASHYYPAKKLGGDFYDLIKVRDKLVIYLSDVMGHGLDSAIMSVFVKNTINNYVNLSPKNKLWPQYILQHLYRQYMQEDYPEDYFVCVFMAVLDLKDNMLNYTGAGFQSFPLVKLGGGEELALDSEGPPISSVYSHDCLDFQEKKLKLNPGSTVFLSTDGLFEHEAHGQMYYERGVKVFYQNSHLSPNAIKQAINEDFREFSKGSLQGDDDITFLILQLANSENTNTGNSSSL